MTEDCPNPLRTDIDISRPRYDQDTYIGRAKHYFFTTLPLNIFASRTRLEDAKSIVEKYRAKEQLCLTEDELWREKQLYDSAYHPETGELMILPGRMSFQVPGNMFTTGGMMTFYKATPAVIFWQWLNQSFNALVNYTNRSGDSDLSNEHLAKCYVAATTTAVLAALTLNKIALRLPTVINRFVPFTAVALTNFVNIPLMRIQELEEGIAIYNQNGDKVATSKNAAQLAIIKVIASRIFMAIPSMVTVPIIMHHFERRGTLCRYPWSAMPLTLLYTGLILTFATPLGCAIFKQQATIQPWQLEKELQESVKSDGQILWYNKGL